MSKKFISKTKNGFDVYVDTETSHAATHLKDHPEIFGLMQEILSEYEVTENVIRFETNMGRIVGKMDCVEITDEDDVFFAKRPNREKYTKFVKGKEPQPTSFVTMEIHQKSDTEYEVFTAFVAPMTPSFPYNKEDPNEKNRDFWKNHALAAGKQEFIAETVTTECPW